MKLKQERVNIFTSLLAKDDCLKLKNVVPAVVKLAEFVRGTTSENWLPHVK